MAYNSNFDVDSILSTLGTVNDKYSNDSAEDEALRIASVALLFIRETHQLDTYREFFRKFYVLARESVLVSQTFATQREADEWLNSGRARDGELVRVEGKGFRVIPKRNEEGLRFLRTPLPEEMETPD